MEPVIIQIHKLLLKHKKTLAVAESCTGGLVSKLLTDLSGSSGYFLLGVAAYSNESKQKIIGIPDSLLRKKGAVSAEVALRMARAIRNLAKSDFGIGITGIAGPGGGSKLKPRGTVYIGVSSRIQTICKKFHFPGSRQAVRKKAALKTLELLNRML